ncbi:MAG: type VI secretion protein IcmF/TssM N-terminal domain-containing protein [Polyangiales bacterium]
MRAPRLAAATVLAFLWLGVSVLPSSNVATGVAGVASVALGIAALVYERRHRGEGAAARRATLEATLRERRSALTPMQQAELATLEEGARDAVARLTAARGRAGAEAVPWILALGVPSSGRSALLASSGLPFSFVTPQAGARGGASVRWWLSEAVAFLDTRGDHVASDAGHAEWLTLLKCVESLRKGQRLQGFVVTLAADMISTAPPETLDGWARRLRERVDEAQALLGIDVPVHLVITRCDQLHGFREFFADLPDSERRQVWGFTLPLAGDSKPAAARIGDELAALLAALSQRSLRRANARDPLEVREAAYQFPLWFASLRPALLRFTANLFEHGVDGGAPLARGVWFTSAAEARTVLPRVPQSGVGYFVHELITRHVVPDGALATPSKAEARRRSHERVLLATPLLAGAALASVLSVYAWRGNSALVSEFSDAMRAASGARAPMGIDVLDALRDRVATLRDHARGGPPRWMRMGFSVAPTLSPRASTVFALFVLRDISRPDLDAAKRSLERHASRPSIAPEERARAEGDLRLYLSLTTPRSAGDPDLRDPAEAERFASDLSQRWSRTRRVSDPPTIALVQRALRLYAALLADDPRLGTPRDVRLTARVQAMLRP